jgi:hypothetical protein
LFVQDSFTDITDTGLAAHTGETGAMWAKHPSIGGVNSFITSADRLRGNGGEYGYWYASGLPASAEYDISAKVHVASVIGGSYLGVAARILTTEQTAYFARYNMSSARWELYKHDNGGFGLLGTYDQSLAAGSTTTMRFEVRNASKKLYVNEIEVISSADNGLAGAGRVGLWMQDFATDSTGLHLDDFEAYPPGGGAPAVVASFAGGLLVPGQGPGSYVF